MSNLFPLDTESGRPDAECLTASNDKTSELAKAHEMLLWGRGNYEDACFNSY